MYENFCTPHNNRVKQSRVRNKISLGIKGAIGVCALLGVVLALVYAERDGYRPWTKRLAYFTTLSNLWIGVVSLMLVIAQAGFSHRKKRIVVLYALRHAFTASIIVTGVVFCAMLAPFADESYHVWSVNSILTHVVVPVLAVIDYFLDEQGGGLGYRHIGFALLPPLLYFSLTGVMGAVGFDFGRGQPFPYFFMDFRGRAGWFGFSSALPMMGTGYWMILLTAFTALIAILLVLPKRKKEKHR